MSLTLSALQLAKVGLRPHVLRPNSKAPLAAGWQNETHFHTTALMQRFDAAPEGANIGLLTGDGLVVVDVDGPEGAASLALMEHDAGPLPKTVRVRTPSGGSHYYFKTRGNLRNSVSRLGRGLDIRAERGNVACPPSVVDGRPYTWFEGCSPFDCGVADLPADWFTIIKMLEAPASTPAASAQPAPTLRTSADRAHAKRRAQLYVAKCPASISGQNGHGALFNAACRAVELCLDEGDALDVLREFNARCEPAWEDSDLARKVREAVKLHPLGEKFDDKERAAGDAAAAGGSRVAGPSSAPDVGDYVGPPEGRPATVVYVEAMQAYVARSPDGLTWNLANPLRTEGAEYALLDEGYDIAVARRFIKNRAVTRAKYIECNPNEPSTYRQGNYTVLNNYVPSAVVPTEGPCPVLDDVLTFLTCGDASARAWLFNWMANAYQFPARPMRTVPVVYGAQRTGKSLISRVMKDLMGPANCANIRNEDVRGRFTSLFVDKLFVSVGEIEAAEVGHATSTLKYLTGDETLTYEAKGSNAFNVPNRIKMLCTSNQTLPVTVEGHGDTRWALFKQLTVPSREYVAAMDSLFNPATNAWSERGAQELAAFAFKLKAHTVDLEMARTVPQNAARSSALEASRSSVDQFVEAVDAGSLDGVWLQFVPEHERTHPGYLHLDLPRHPELTGALALYTVYKAFCRGSGLQALGTGRFPVELEKYRPDWFKTKAAGSVCEQRPNIYEGVPRNRALRQAYLPFEDREPAPPVDAPPTRRNLFEDMDEETP